MLLPDLLHELELGVWRTLFIHLLRLLDAEDEALKDELDRRSVHNARVLAVWSNQSVQIQADAILSRCNPKDFVQPFRAEKDYSARIRRYAAGMPNRTRLMLRSRTIIVRLLYQCLRASCLPDTTPA